MFWQAFFQQMEMDASSNINVRMILGEVERCVEVRLHDHIGVLSKELIADRLSAHEHDINESVRVIFKGKELSHGDTFFAANVGDNDICHVVLGPKRVCHQSGGEDHMGVKMLGQVDLFLIAMIIICLFYWILFFSLDQPVGRNVGSEVAGLSIASLNFLCIAFTSFTLLACFIRASRA